VSCVQKGFSEGGRGRIALFTICLLRLHLNLHGPLIGSNHANQKE
jgi:hypothetical protein